MDTIALCVNWKVSRTHTFIYLSLPLSLCHSPAYFASMSKWSNSSYVLAKLFPWDIQVESVYESEVVQEIRGEKAQTSKRVWENWSKNSIISLSLLNAQMRIE